MRSIALVGMNGSIDFLRYQEFDFPTMFAALFEQEAAQSNEIIRTVSVIRGNVHFEMRCLPPMALYSTIVLHQQSQEAIANSSLRAGTTAAFVFGGLLPEGQQPDLIFRRAAFSRNSPVLENVDRKTGIA